MRLFIGVFLPVPIRQHLVHQLGPSPFPGFRITAPESLHVTLKFIGSAQEFHVPSIASKLTPLAARHARFELGLQGGGLFPNRKAPRVFWVGLTGEVDNLKTIAEETEVAMDELGFPLENRNFKPHLTMARAAVDGRLEKEGIRFCKLFADYKSPMFQVSSIALVQSRLGSSGSRYEILQSFPLGQPV